MATLFPLAASAERLIVKRDKEVTQSKGGILLPDTAKRKTMRATVVDVGPSGTTTTGADMPNMPWKHGDNVYISTYAGHELESDDVEEKLVVIHRDDVLATERTKR